MIDAIRGATTIENPVRAELLDATVEMLEKIMERNKLAKENIVAAYFTVTKDIQVAFPAEAARLMGWDACALMDALEIDVPGALEKCIRVMVLIDTENKIDKKHIYLRGAKRLRPDLDGDE